MMINKIKQFVDKKNWLKRLDTNSLKIKIHLNALKQSNKYISILNFVYQCNSQPKVPSLLDYFQQECITTK